MPTGAWISQGISKRSWQCQYVAANPTKCQQYDMKSTTLGTILVTRVTLVQEISQSVLLWWYIPARYENIEYLFPCSIKLPFIPHID